MENSSGIKSKLFKQCHQFCINRYNAIQSQINEIIKALTSETKSSAGDKHETGRAMLHLEREKLGNQLAELQKLQEILSRIQIEKTLKIIGLGSVVYTSQANYFIAISAGELRLEDVTYYAISAQTPIAKLLLGKKINNMVEFGEQKFKIEKII